MKKLLETSLKQKKKSFNTYKKKKHERKRNLAPFGADIFSLRIKRVFRISEDKIELQHLLYTPYFKFITYPQEQKSLAVDFHPAQNRGGSSS